MYPALSQDSLLFLGSVFVFSLISIIVFRVLAPYIGLLDRPDTAIKLHQVSVPVVGGLAVYCALLASALLFFSWDNNTLIWLMASAGAIVLLGLHDDYRPTDYKVRLLGQIVICTAMILATDLRIDSVGNGWLLGQVHFPPAIGALLTVLFVVTLINAFNMLDGVDGLAGTLGATAAVGMLMQHAWSDSPVYTLLPAALALALLPHILANLSLLGKPKVFLGDAGSFLIGYLVAWLLILQSQADSQSAFQPAQWLWIIALPLAEITTTTARRFLDGRSPFLGDRKHMHHLLLMSGFSPLQVSLGLATLAIALCWLGMRLSDYSVKLSLVAFVLFLLLAAALTHLWSRRLDAKPAD